MNAIIYARFSSDRQREESIEGQVRECREYAEKNGGSIPLGYKIGQDQRLEIDPATAPVVKEIFQRYAEGDTIREIITDLNARGIKTSRGYKFSYSGFNLLLQNRKYIGEFRYQDVVIPGGVPAIVDEDIFKRVQARMAKNKQAPATAKAKENYILTTKLFCGNCGKIMFGESGKGTGGKIYRYYKCANAKKKAGCHKKAVKKDWIENLVICQTMALVMDKPLMTRIIDRLVEMQGEESFDIKLLERQLKETDRGIENMLNAIQAGIIIASTKQRLATLEEQKAQLEEQILQERIKNPALSREQIAFFLDQYKKTDITDEVQRQRLIDCFVNAVFVYDDKIVMTFNYKDGTKTISLEDVNSSDLEQCSPPSLVDKRDAGKNPALRCGIFALKQR